MRSIVFKKHGALGASYFALIATGPNTYYTHYNRNTATLADGDLVQFDYAPDFKYYQSDVTRVFPANGGFTPRQREAYEIYLRLYRAVHDIDPGPQDAGGRHQGRGGQDGRDYRVVPVHRREESRRPRATIVENYRRQSTDAAIPWTQRWASRSTTSAACRPVLEPGHVFTIEPQMRIEEEHTASGSRT